MKHPSKINIDLHACQCELEGWNTSTKNHQILTSDCKEKKSIFRKRK